MTTPNTLRLLVRFQLRYQSNSKPRLTTVHTVDWEHRNWSLLGLHCITSWPLTLYFYCPYNFEVSLRNVPKDVRREIQSIESTKFLNQKYKDPSYPVAQMGRDLDSKHTRSWWSYKAATVLAGVLRPLVSPQDVHARDALSDTGVLPSAREQKGVFLIKTLSTMTHG